MSNVIGLDGLVVEKDMEIMVTHTVCVNRDASEWVLEGPARFEGGLSGPMRFGVKIYLAILLWPRVIAMACAPGVPASTL